MQVNGSSFFLGVNALDFAAAKRIPPCATFFLNYIQQADGQRNGKFDQTLLSIGTNLRSSGPT
jgi:hypothetical protein